MSKNTPGPWGLNPGKDRDHDIPLIRVSGADGSSFAFIFENNHTGELSVDDARLIAAAPELLDEMRSALATAQDGLENVESGDEEGVRMALEAIRSGLEAAVAKAIKEEA